MGRNLGPLNIKDTYEGLVQITSGSIITDGSGSDITYLNITASNADQSGTAGYASTAGFASQAGTAGFATTATSASWADQAGTSGFATSASYAATASVLLGGISLQRVLDTGNSATEDINLTGDLSLRSVRAGNINIQGLGYTNSVLNDGANNKSIAIGASNAGGKDTILIGDGNSSFNSNSSDNIAIGISNDIDGPFTDYSIALGVLNTISSNGDGRVVIGYNNTSTSGAYGGVFAGTNNTAGHTRSVIIGGTGLSTVKADEVVVPSLRAVGDITGSNATFTSASIGHLTTVTGSAVIIGDAYVIVNSSDTTRYAGIKVYESGSVVPTTASLEFDSVTNDWFYSYTGSDPTNFGAVMFGPEYGTKGSPIYPTANTLVKGNGGHHLIDSSITDDGTDVVVNANISASGYVSASAFIGDGSQLTGIISNPTLQDVTTNGNQTSNNIIVTGSLNVSADGSNSTVSSGVALAGISNSVTGTNSGIFAGNNNTVSGDSAGVLAGAYCQANGLRSATLGAENSTVSGQSAIAIGGYGHNVNGPEAGAYSGDRNTINARGYTLGGHNHNINTDANYSAIIAGEGHTINNSVTQTVILGGDSITATQNDSVYVPHLVITGSVSAYDGGQIATSSSLGTGSLIDNVGTPTPSEAIEHIVYLSQAEYDVLIPDANTMYVISGSTDIVQNLVVSGSMIGAVNSISVASSTGSLDCSTGNYFTLGLANAADTRLEASNIQIGQTINIKITNNATAAGTISFGPEFEFEGGSAFTATAATNAVDIITAVSFDGTSLQVVGVKNFS